MVKKRTEKVLLYHFQEDARLETIRALLLTFGIENHVLPEEAWGQTVGCLLGLKGFPRKAAPPETASFPHEVMIFYQLEDRRLDQVLEAFRKAEIPRVRYKAVVTPMNRFWSLRRLCETMEKEHAYMVQREDTV